MYKIFKIDKDLYSKSFIKYFSICENVNITTSVIFDKLVKENILHPLIVDNFYYSIGIFIKRDMPEIFIKYKDTRKYILYMCPI